EGSAAVPEMTEADARQSPSVQHHEEGLAAAPGGLGDDERALTSYGSTVAPEAMTATLVPQSPSAREHEEGSAAAPGGLGEDEQVLTMDVPMVAEVVDGGDVVESGSPKAVESEQQTAPPEASQGVAGTLARPPSPPVVPQAASEEAAMEVIDRAGPQPRPVRILYLVGTEVVDEDTPSEMARLRATLTEALAQSEVSTASGKLVRGVGRQNLKMSLCICRV
ncbi:MAG TPA: hypothetical protein VFB30_03230, partial [Spirochaetia bacterium]|nr:hypothetical protein [Spirochaetia bacterium]